MLYTVVKSFDEMTPRQIWALYRLRVAVFVVEQNCPYQEVDALDLQSLHLWLAEEPGGDPVACLRAIPPGLRYEEASIGRVISARRGEGLGFQVMEEGIRLVRERFGNPPIRIAAQCAAKGFYEKFGFVPDSQVFEEDGIPHQEMLLVPE